MSVQKNERLGLLGGSFDPVHNGHLALARAFGSAVEADRVLLLPAKEPPHKPGRKLADERDRLAMCRLAVEDDPALEASDLELTLPAPSYTVNTLRALQKSRPGSALFLLCGGDMLLNLRHWKEFEAILRLCTVCAAPRGENDRDRLTACAEEYHALGGQVQILDMKPVDLSSTDIRNKVGAGEPIAGLVPKQVEEYILCRGLYRDASISDSGGSSLTNSGKHGLK